MATIINEPSTDEIIELRLSIQELNNLQPDAAKEYCAELAHSTKRSWQRWERGHAKMHSAIFELVEMKMQTMIP